MMRATVALLYTVMFTLVSTALTMVGASTADARPVIIFSGGFGSCFVAGYTSEIKASAQMDEFVERVRAETGQDPAQIRTCYAFGSDQIYVSSDALGTDSETMTREGFHQVVQQTVSVASEGQGPASVKIYLWGQSHGGWTAMDLVRKVSGLNYRILMTVDPISVENCGPAVFSGGVLTGYAPGCNEAPADMRPSGKTIAGRVGRWVNWYQTQFPHLHSDKIPSAHENIFRSYEDDFWNLAGAHGMIEVDPEVWKDIGQRVISDLRAH
jgi:hypothetical protein